MIMRKIAVYGGSFDPPHKGHLHLARNLAERCGAEKVIIIPTSLSPFKNSSGASAEDRLNMCQLAFSDSLFDISDIEIKRGGKSYTIDTLNDIKRVYKDSELFLFMGDDMLLSFDKWYKYQDILNIATLVCACRKDKENLMVQMRSFAENVLKLPKDGILFCEAEPLEISSTDIRGGSDDFKKQFLVSKVYDYIIEKGLYK